MDGITRIRTRFAPSPTGRLHLGHALAARVAHDLARSQPGGRFLLRFEDIDAPRVRPEFYQEIEEDLQWLGFPWDEPPLRQTTRGGAYAAALTELRGRDLVYPCFCTRREIQNELADMAAAPHGPEGPVYPGTCRHLNVAEREARIAAGLAHAWRLDARKAAGAAGPLAFRDLRFGAIAVDPDLLGDVVLARKDIGTAYHLAVVVDDAFQHISHVTRGEDLLPSTHVHRLLQNLLGLPEPVYLHHELVLDEHGKRLAKRHDALAIAALRGAGRTPGQVLTRIRGMGLRPVSESGHPAC
jgi:glutamyl-Q tRNA(Asp) synthetase